MGYGDAALVGRHHDASGDSPYAEARPKLDSPLPVDSSRRDSSSDRDVGLTEAGSAGDAHVEAYSPPPRDAARFDGCVPGACRPNQLCINELTYLGREIFSICYEP